MPLHLATLCLLLAFGPRPTHAQASVRDGDRVRIQLTGDGWIEGYVDRGPADSLDVRLRSAVAVVRTPPDALRMERLAGHRRGAGASRGALIGATLGAVVVGVSLPGDTQGYRPLLMVIGAIGGLLPGLVVGAALAPPQWEPVRPDPTRCGAWRLAPGSDVSVRNASLSIRGQVAEHGERELRFASATAGGAAPAAMSTADARWELSGPRGSKRGALIGAGIGTAIAVAGAASDSEIERGQVPLLVLSNAGFGALIGYYVAPPRRTAIPLGCG